MSKGNFIAGEWIPGGGMAFDSLDPATQKSIWKGEAASDAQVTQAVAAARKAFDGWRKTPLDARVAIVERFAALLKERGEEFAVLISRETGKMLWDSRGEVQAMIGKAAVSITAYHTRTGYNESMAAGVRQVLRHRPHGVLAVFGPYNFPGHLPNGHIMPALIAGNTVVFKPSEHTPLVAESMVALWQEAGIPAGVINLVQGAREVGASLAAAAIDGILFTGSAEVGALLHRQLAGDPGKLLALEMGGNNPLIAWDSADAKAAALIVLQSAFLTTGQRCSCARRLIVPDNSFGDALLELVTDAAAKLKISRYDDTPPGYMGPLISNTETEKILAAEASLISLGGRPLLRMKRLHENLPFVSAGIIDVTLAENRPDREYFGPLLQVVRVRDFGQAMEEANNTRFGLSAALISDDAALYEQFVAEVRAGTVNWNRPTNGASSALPFGGVGASGNHRPSAFYAADYTAYPVASQESEVAELPETYPHGVYL